MFGRLLRRGCHRVQAEVVSGDEPAAQQFLNDKFVPAVPVRRALGLYEHNRMWIGLSGLDQREQLKRLVHGAETSGE